MARTKPSSPAETPLPDNATPPDRLAEPIDAEQPPRLGFPVVGIGASAGGLESFIEFFKAMRSDSGMAFVLIQHLPPDRQSLIAEILARHTPMPVQEIVDGVPVEPDHVYIIRPGNTVTLHEGKLHLGAPVEKRGHTRPVDDFFRSLAEEQRQRAICVVMSGMGSNGTTGAENVKAVGGLCIAEDPETAKFPSMPRSLIDHGLADFVLRTTEIPEVLIRYARHPYAASSTPLSLEERQERQALSEILAVLRARLRHDFSGYKKPTLVRRIQRRMGLNQITAMRDYTRLLRQNPGEATALADDLMIHVTGFFRDPEVWTALQQKVIVPLVAERADDTPIRAWVTACASGEEAYTLAILLLEAAEAAGKSFDIKIFATDTAERSLNQARAAIFPGGIESELSPERLERYFDRDDANYRVKKFLRELVVFAPQNILQDPPFSRLDICTCRNLLIYLEPEVQRRALAFMHFGLRENGTLLLGTSETVVGAEDLFEPLDKKFRIFRRVGPTRHGTVDFPFQAAVRGNGDADVGLARLSVAQLAQRTLLDRFSPAAVVVDRQQRIAYFHGATDRFLDQPRGEPTREILTLAREFVRGAIRVALQRAFSQNEACSVRDGTIETPAGRHRVEVNVSPLDLKPSNTYFLVSFIEIPESTLPTSLHVLGEATPESQQRVEEELARVRDELQSTIEELQTSNEEMKVSNEEVTSVNEELQSTNEELETSKEELQSLNEELTTVNAQLQVKMEELESSNNDLGSLLSSTDIAVLFLDTQFRIRRFTPAVKDLFDVIPADIGRPLNDLAKKFSDDDLLSDAQTVLAKLIPLEKEIASGSGRVYMRRALPYRTTDNRIDGIVVTFIDITERSRAQSALRESEERHRLILQGITEYAIFMLDANGRAATWTAGAERVLGYTLTEAIGLPLETFTVPEERNLVAFQLDTAREHGSCAEDGWHQRKDGKRFWGSGMISALRDEAGQLRGFVKVLRDNTDRKLSEEALKQAKRSADLANESKDQFLATVSHELRTPLSAIVLWASLIEDQKIPDPQQLLEAITAIKRSAEEQRELIEDLVDTSRIVTGKLRLELRETNLPSLVHQAVDSVRQPAIEKQIVIEETIDPKVDTVFTDGSRIQQIVRNLVGNAIKFTPNSGRITVELRRFGDEVQLAVTDTGIGIDHEILPQIFQRFVQGDSVSTRSEGGLGLGLAIVKQLVEMHGGTITADSPGVNRGSTFTVRLPLPPVEKTGENSPNPSRIPLPRSLREVNILLIEDVVSTRRALTAVLEEAGAEIVAVDSAPAAWEAFERRRPDIIVSDLGLPTIDGYALIRQIRDAESTANSPRIPAVALTAFAGDAIRRKALEHGFDACVTKPIEPVLLVNSLLTVLTSTGATSR